MTSTSVLRLRHKPRLLDLFGAVRVMAGDGTPLPMGPRTAMLVALVLLGGASNRAQLAGLLYPQIGAAGGRRNLRQLLHKQRRVLDLAIEQRGFCLVALPGLRVLVEPEGDNAKGRHNGARRALKTLARLLGEGLPAT